MVTSFCILFVKCYEINDFKVNLLYNCCYVKEVKFMENVYVFGHRNPDTDSVGAAVSLAHLKTKLGVNAVPAVLSSINLETNTIPTSTPIPNTPAINIFVNKLLKLTISLIKAIIG